MTATDRLRALLDERGVEWDADDEAMDDGSLSQVTYWYCNGIEWSADGRDEYLAFDAVQLLTPEQAIAATLGSCSCTGDCTNSGRTGTCTADETDRIECGTIDGRHYDIHVMECSECGHTYEHVNGGYEFCPHCGRRIEVD